jgi:hypothetical protein
VKKLKRGASVEILLWSGENLREKIDDVSDAGLQLDMIDRNNPQLSTGVDPRGSNSRIDLRTKPKRKRETDRAERRGAGEKDSLQGPKAPTPNIRLRLKVRPQGKAARRLRAETSSRFRSLDLRSHSSPTLLMILCL